MQRRIFLDYASTTPLDKRVLKAMMPYLTSDFGNPSAIYYEGVKAKKVVKECRTTIARLLNIRPEEIIFTATGTEADNLAIRGVVEAWRNLGIGFPSVGNPIPKPPHIVTTNIEHPGILEMCKQLEKEGIEVTYVPVEENGIVDPQKIKQALKSTTILVTVMFANNEIGTIQPLRDISRVIAEFKKESGQRLHIPYFHTDASQAANYLDLSFQKLGVDMMTLDASKIYGPKGTGLLAVKRQVSLKPIIVGGGQEKGLRSGTENVPGIIGMAKALEIVAATREKESTRLRKLQNEFFNNVIKISPRVFINGDLEKRLPNNINICIEGIDSEFAVIKLDTVGLSVSSASSCINLSEEPYSYVIEALGPRGKQCKGASLRFTLGQATKKKDLDLTLAQITSII
jgi:cysteine desulfurase